jgi:ATP-binding cassette subfamily B protein
MKNIKRCEGCISSAQNWYYGALLALGVVTAVLGVVINFVQGEIVRQLQNISNSPINWWWVYVWLAMYIVPTIIEEIRGYFSRILQDRLLLQNRNELTELLARVPYEMHERSTFREDIQFLEKNSWRHWQYLYAHFQLIGAITSTIAGFIALFLLSWVAAIIIFLASIPLYLVASNYGKRWYKVAEETSDLDYRAYYISEQFTRLKPVGLIKMFGLEDLLLSLFRSLSKEVSQVQEKTSRSEFLANLGANCGMQVIGAALIFSIILVLTNNAVLAEQFFLNKGTKVDLGLFTTGIGVIGGLIMSVQNLVSLNGNLAQHGAYIKRRKNFEASIEIEDLESLDPIQDDGFEIQFVNVWFKYPNSYQWIFKGLNLTLKAGERVALLGDNGAGKSTLFKLLSGLYTPNKGQILINGQPLSSIDRVEYRRKVAFMLQDQEPLEGITAAQLVSGKQVLSENDTERVFDVCTMSGANWFIERLPKGYDSPTGPKTTRSALSGGEHQRLALAQVLFRRPRLALLDEPTSALDFGGKLHVLNVLRSLPVTTGFIIAAHEPLVMDLVTRIIVLERGGAITDHSRNSQGLIESPYFKEMLETYKKAMGL